MSSTLHTPKKLPSFFTIIIIQYFLMTIKGGTSQACAACKYQRRRCSKDCALAPYFPADQPKMFQNAHRLFGVRNIMRILSQVHPSQKDETMTSIIYESNMRSRFPVHGCCGVIWQLHYQIQQVTEELRLVKNKVALVKDPYQNQMLNNNSSNNNNNIGIDAADGNVAPDVVYPVYAQQQPYNSGFFLNQQANTDVLINDPFGGIFFDNINNNDGGGGDEMLMLKDMRIQQHYNDNYGVNLGNVDSMLLQSNLIPGAQGYPLQQEMEISHDYDEIPFDTLADDRQSYIDSREACDSSAESTLKDVSESSHEYVTKTDLKNRMLKLALD